MDIMPKIIDVHKALEGTPRPHYLVERAEYINRGNVHVLNGTVNFSSEGNPSIADRAKNYLSSPHVNVGDVCFAMWNAAHIIGGILGYSQRTLINEVRIVPHERIPPDINIGLELKISGGQFKEDKQGRQYTLGKIVGKLIHGKLLLTEVYTDIFARE
ncbi:hypothetical protein HYS47_02720 [Candidatus Woesearchaeota archaeon]|nr:hypothetical protein [Candidatus Woesearchaeota archaeon]